MRDCLAKPRGCDVLTIPHNSNLSSGAMFAYIKHPFTDQLAKQIAMRLAGENDVLCLPGSMFGPGQEAHLRVAFANAKASDMETLVERLIESQG